MTKIASFNVNSIAKRLPVVLAWLEAHQPDVLVLQELKCEAAKFPHQAIEAAGYHCSVVGQKAYNGVAIITKAAHQIRRQTLPEVEDCEDTPQARYIEIDYNLNHATSMIIAGLYLPNGNPVDGGQHAKFRYKLAWMQHLYTHAQYLLQQEVPVVITGDFNIIPHDIDCYDPAAWEQDALCHPEARRMFYALCHLGYADAWRLLHPQQRQYSFWDYQAGRWQKGDGIRIDHLLLSPLAQERLREAGIDASPRGQPQPSDHTPVWCRLDNTE